jgi:UDPglucose 6-dehydrogenase
MKITIIGTGYVGLVAGTCFADFGMDVTCIDNNTQKIESLKRGIIPIYEPGLEELVNKNYNAGTLKFSTDTSHLNEADILIIAVGTPAGKDGNADLSSIYSVINDIIAHVKTNKFILIKSTVPIGTAAILRQTLQDKCKNLKFDIISNPEFLRQGSAVRDFLEPDRIIIGSQSKDAKEIACKLYGPLILKDIPILFTDNNSAEIIKYAANTYLAMRVAFINEISDISEKLAGDIDDIAHGLGLDKRISKHFLHPSPGYGGSCFPKDTLALSKVASEANANCLIINAVIESNIQRKLRMAEKIIDTFNGNIRGKQISILGLTFKAETNDLRDSASIDIINELIKHGARIKAYDPKGMSEARKIFGTKIEYCKDSYDAASNCEALCILTEWAEFKTLELDKLNALMLNPTIIDLRNIFSPNEIMKAGFNYISLGRTDIIMDNECRNYQKLKVS